MSAGRLGPLLATIAAGSDIGHPLLCPLRGLRVVGCLGKGDHTSLNKMVEPATHVDKGLRDAPTRLGTTGCDAADGRLVDTSGFGHGVLAVPLRSEV